MQIRKEPVIYKHLQTGEQLSEDEFARRKQEKRLAPGNYHVFDRYEAVNRLEFIMPNPPNTREEWQKFNDTIISILRIIMANLNNLQSVKEQLSAIIQSDPRMKWMIIATLLPEPTVNNEYILTKAGTNDLTKTFNHPIRWNKTQLQLIFNTLVDCGAEVNTATISQYPFNKFKTLLEALGSRLNDQQIATYALWSRQFDGPALDQPAIEWLVKSGLDSNCAEYIKGRTILHDLSVREAPGTHYIVALLCIAVFKADFCRQDKALNTPLMLAVRRRNVDAVNALCFLTSRNIAFGINTPDRLGRTPLMMAAALGCLEIVVKLLSAGADLSLRDPQGRDVFDYVNFTPEQTAELLNTIFIAPERPLTAKRTWLQADDIHQSLLVSVNPDGITERICLNRANWQKIQPWLQQIKTSNPQLYECVLSQFLPVIENREPEVSVLQSCFTERPRIAKQLHVVRADSLREACALGLTDRVKQYLTSGANPDEQDAKLRTALHFVVMRPELVEKIRKEKMPERSLSECMKQHVAVARLLLDAGADVLRVNSMGNSSFDLVMRDLKSTTEAADTPDNTLAKKTTFDLVQLLAQPLFKQLNELMGLQFVEQHTADCWSFLYKSNVQQFGIKLFSKLEKNHQAWFLNKLASKAITKNIILTIEFVDDDKDPKYCYLWIKNADELLKEVYQPKIGSANLGRTLPVTGP